MKRACVVLLQAGIVFLASSATVFAAEKKDSVDHFNALAQKKMESHAAVAEKYALKAYHLATEEGYKAGAGKALFLLGKIYYTLNKPSSSLDSYLQASGLYESLNDSTGAGLSYNGVGTVYMQKMSNHGKAVQFFSRAIQLLQRDSLNLMKALNNMGIHYSRIEDYDKALETYRAVYALAEKKHEYQLMGRSLNNIGALYDHLGDHKSSLVYLEKALAVHTANNDALGMANALSNMAIQYSQQKQYERSIKTAHRAIALAKQHEYHDIIVYALLTLSNQFQSTHVLDSARMYAEEAEKVVVKNGITYLKGPLYMELSEVYQQMKEMDKAFYYQERYARFTDSLAKEERKNVAVTVERTNPPAASSFSILGFWLPLSGGVVLVGASVGALLYKKRKREKKALVESVLKGQEEERNRLARDIHDGLGSVLSSVKHNLTSIKGNMVMTGDDMVAFNRSVDLIDHSMKELRTVAHNMMPEVLLRFGLKEALQDFCEHLNTGGLKVEYIAVNMDARIDNTKEILVYRIVQELMNNILKYANATSVLVQLLRDNNRVSLTVEDNGVGFNPEKLQNSRGAGWLNIHRRVEGLAGKIVLDSRPGRGTSVMLDFYV